MPLTFSCEETEAGAHQETLTHQVLALESWLHQDWAPGHLGQTHCTISSAALYPENHWIAFWVRRVCRMMIYLQTKWVFPTPFLLLFIF